MLELICFTLHVLQCDFCTWCWNDILCSARLQFSLQDTLCSRGHSGRSLTLETAGSLQVAQTSSEKPLLHFLHIGLQCGMLLHVNHIILHFVSFLFRVQLPEVVASHSCQLDYNKKGVQSSFQRKPLSKALSFAVHSNMIQLGVCVGWKQKSQNAFKTSLIQFHIELLYWPYSVIAASGGANLENLTRF